MKILYDKYDPATYHSRSLYRKVCETNDLRHVWAYKNALKWGVSPEDFIKKCGDVCACCETSVLDYGLGKNNVDKKDVNTPSTDHIIPRSAGGTDDISNLWIICNRCNTFKNSALADDIHRFEAIIKVLKSIGEIDKS